MKAIDRPFSKIINGTTQFVIPVFQRDYSWTEGHCEQLWKDVIRVGTLSEENGHFLGSLVYVSTGDTSAGFTRWLLIDGQQRLTTLTLLLAALRDHIVDKNWSGQSDGPTEKRLDAYFLKNVQEEGERIPKLVLRRHDQEILQAIVEKTEPPAESTSTIKNNYEFFREQLSDADPEVVYRGIGRLNVVDVTLDRGTDDPQLIFESLNSTGLDLSQSDLIRNFILMRLTEKEQTRLYETYWSKIEILFRGSERTFDAFIRDYIALRTQATKQERADAIYFAFRREFGSIGTGETDLEGLLQELLRYARHHAAFSIGLGAPIELKDPLARLRKLVDVPATLVMRLFECQNVACSLKMAEFCDAIALLESYVFRRAICGEQTRGYWQVFANLAYQISNDRPLESLKVGLACLPESYRFPADEDFRSALQEREIYQKRVCFDLLDRLENYGSNEPSDTSSYSIEHIMPQSQKLRIEWRRMLGENWQDIQREWLHKLGNLTLTGYNSAYSDRPFEQKKTIEGGFADSSVRLNKYVREQSVWTPKQMKLRGEQLARKALTIWPSLIVENRLVKEAQKAEMRMRAQRRDVEKVPMSAPARNLFEKLRTEVRGLDDDIFELAEQRSVSYHDPAFFLEVLPRKNRIGLLLALDFNEVMDPAGIAQDATQWDYFKHATYEGGVYIEIDSESDIEGALPIIRQAREVSRA